MAGKVGIGFDLFLFHNNRITPSLKARYAPALPYRLTIDPKNHDFGNNKCQMDLVWIKRPSRDQADTEASVDWCDYDKLDVLHPDTCYGAPELRVTEDAAIGMMALLVRRLEHGVIDCVLPIGTGADYLVTIRIDGESLPVEVSGLRIARYPSSTQGRLDEKYGQLLGSNHRGFVSVTTFAFCKDGTLHSHFHYVENERLPRGDAAKSHAMSTPANLLQDASIASMEAGVAMQSGDVAKSRRLHLEAARVLRECERSVYKVRDRAYIKYLLATQYYLGGMYAKANFVAARIEPRFIPNKLRGQFEQFVVDVSRRAKPRYAQDTRDLLSRYWSKNSYESILCVLQHHPYIVEQSALSYIKGFALFSLGRYRAAAIHFASAAKLGNVPTGAVMGAACFVTSVQRAEGHEAALKVVRVMAKYFPHVATSLSAVVVAYQAALVATTPLKESLFSEAVSFLQVAKSQMNEAPQNFRNDESVREYYAICLAAGAIACRALGKRDVSRTYLEDAVSLHIDNWEVRSILKTISGNINKEISWPFDPSASSGKSSKSRWNDYGDEVARYIQSALKSTSFNQAA